MGIFNYQDTDALGTVIAVDTATLVVRVADVEKLRRMQVNRLVALQSSRAGEYLIGVVQKIVRSMKEARAVGEDNPTEEETQIEENIGDYIHELTLLKSSILAGFEQCGRGRGESSIKPDMA